MNEFYSTARLNIIPVPPRPLIPLGPKIRTYVPVRTYLPTYEYCTRLETGWTFIRWTWKQQPDGRIILQRIHQLTIWQSSNIRLGFKQGHVLRTILATCTLLYTPCRRRVSLNCMSSILWFWSDRPKPQVARILVCICTLGPKIAFRSA